MLFNKSALPDQDYVIWTNIDEKIPVLDLQEMIANYLNSHELHRLDMYNKYYEGQNAELAKRYRDRVARSKTPNNFIPTSYYSTVVDTMAGYMFSDVKYISDAPEDEEYISVITDLFNRNNADIKAMQTGIRALAYNKGIELVYTVGDGLSEPDIKFTSIDPRSMLLVWDDNIEPSIYCGIRITKSNEKKHDYNVDVIYKDEWQYYYMDGGALTVRKESRQLFFDECPVILYKADMMSVNSTFQTILPYIDALDYLVSGNSNELERLVDAILVIGKILSDEDKLHMDEWKTLENMKQEDRAEYLTKDMSPAFREYVSKLLIQEIHKHSHVIDWYSPDSGLSGDISAKAMRTRLFDMDMKSQSIEKIFKEGDEKKLRLIDRLFSIIGTPVGNADIVYNRTLPSDFEEKAPVLNMLTYISDKTKLEMLGLDPERELPLLDEQKEKNMERFALESRVDDTEEDTTDPAEDDTV